MPEQDRGGMYRRDFGTTMAGAGISLALAKQARGASTGRTELRTLFFNLSHESHEGHEYALVVGKSRHILQRTTGSHPALAPARRGSRLMNAVPANAITHVLENIRLPSDAVQASYLQKDANPNTGTWGMTAIFVLPPKGSFRHAYERARALTADGPLPLSAKRRKYGLPPALTLQDLLEEQDVVDFTDFATALVNLHPEMLSADPNSAAHIQTNHIQTLQSLGDVHDALECAGTALPQGQTGSNVCGSSAFHPGTDPVDNPSGWATLVPYTDENNVPLRSTSPNTKGLILYDAKWQPSITSPWITKAMSEASKTIKSDETVLGKDVTSGRSQFTDADLTGRIWFRNDGVTSIDQSSRQMALSGNASFILSNITQSYGGYSVDADVTLSGSDANVSLKYKNWYLRWLGLYIQFLKADGITVVPSGELPGISRNSGFDTANNELFVGILTPEFTVFGVPVQASGNSLSFTFPKTASSAKIIASGLGRGSHTFQDTEIVGIVMTSIFNLSMPMFLLAFGLGATVDAFYKLVAIPSAAGVVQFIVSVTEGATAQQIGAIVWKSIVRGIANPNGLLKEFLETLIAFLAEAEIIESFEDAIPLVGAILQAIGALGVIAEVAETSCEVVLSPWTYEYDLVGTHDLAVTVLPDPMDKAGFPGSAATYKVTAIFDNGTPQVQTLAMPGGTPPSLQVQFKGMPLGGNVTVNVGFYTQDGTQVGHGSQGTKNDVGSSVTITITEDRLPIRTGTTYQHKQKTSLDAQGNHVWSCKLPAPVVPESQSLCQPNPGNLCSFREITMSALGYVGYGWQSFSTSPCQGASAQLDQLANIPIANSGSGNAQTGYALTPCSLGGAARLIYDPLGRPDSNFYVDTTQDVNVVRQVKLSAPGFDPTSKMAWGVFNLPPTDILLHPAGAIVTINSANHRMEMLKLPTAPMADADAAVNLLATLHGGQGTRPGLFDAPTVAAITAEGTVLIIESGNNRIHAVDIAGNPVRLFSKQPVGYFLNFSRTGGAGTQYLDVAVEFSGFIYVLSFKNPVYRLDIYHRDQTGTDPISTTMGFNAAKIAVDYWRNVYSLNYEVLKKTDGNLPSVTEPSISQWIPTTPPPCQGMALNVVPPIERRRLLRRRNFWKTDFA